MLRLQMHASTPGAYVGTWDLNPGPHAYSAGTYLLSRLSRPMETIVEYKAGELKRGGSYVLRVFAILG